MNMRKKRGFILLMIFTATLSVLYAGEDWQSDATRAERYYIEAAGKIQALSEVSRALRTLAKIRKTRAAKISAAGH